MPRGGYRPGSGRPRGALNLLTREINERMLAKGLTKAEATLDVMRFYYAQAIALTEQVDAQSGQPANATERRRHARMYGEMMRLRQLAFRAAAKAAPYVHPRMGYVRDDDGE